MKDTIEIAAAKIHQMGCTDATTYLTQGNYTKAELQAIGKAVNCTLSLSFNKNQLIRTLANHVGYKDIAKRMYDRPNSFEQYCSGHGGTREGAGRPVGSTISDKRKSRNIRATDDEWQAIQDRATAAGMSASEYIRKMALGGD